MKPEYRLNECRCLIDGYNLVFQCGLEGRSRDSLSLERARARLIAAIATRYSKSECATVTVVFDARTLPIKEDHSISKKSGITVVFAVEYEDADSLIEELIQKNSTPKNLTVVSSDHRLHRAALRRKATPIDSDVWFDELEQLPPRVDGADGGLDSSDSNVEEKDVPDSLKNVDWAEEFGFSDDELSG